MSDPVRFELTCDEALVLFEWLSQREEQANKENPNDDSPLSPEELVLTRILGVLERTLVEPFMPNYDVFLAAARRRVQESA